MSRALGSLLSAHVRLGSRLTANMCGSAISIITPGCVRVFVRSFVRPCVRVKNGNGSCMRALPDELSPVTREVHGDRSKYRVSVFKCEMMLALSSDYKPLSRDVRHFFTKVSGGIVL